jgi:alanine-synthesizing transaminase
MFAWAPLPAGCEAMGSLDFAKQLMEEAGVAVAPGIGCGEHGEGFVRLALVENEQRIRQAARSVGEFLKTRQPAIRAV